MIVINLCLVNGFEHETGVFSLKEPSTGNRPAQVSGQLLGRTGNTDGSWIEMNDLRNIQGH